MPDGTFSVSLPEGAPRSHPKLGQPSCWWIYLNGLGEPVAVVYRFDTPDGKEYRPYDLERNTWGAPEHRRLYRLHAVRASNDPVVLVEGEKCADALAPFGIAATSGIGGANAIRKTDLTPLKGRKVIIWPDNDEAGQRYAKDAAEALRMVEAASIEILPVDSVTLDNVARDTEAPNVTLCKGWDAADAVEAGWGREALYSYIGRAVPYIDYIGESDGAPELYIDILYRREPEPKPSVGNGKVSWPRPDRSVLQPRFPAPPFPVDIFGPSWGSWLRRKAEEASAPIDYVGGSLISAAGALIGNARWVQPWQGWEEPPALWLSLVGAPSSSKSPGMGPVLNTLRELEAELLPEHDEAMREFEAKELAAQIAREEWEKAAKKASKDGGPIPPKPVEAVEPERPERPRIRVSDITPEALAALLACQPKGVLSVRDELSGWLGNFDRYGGKGGDRAFWIESYGGRSYTVDRKKQDGKPIYIPYLTMGVLGGIQPDRLNSLLLQGDDDGLPARFLYLWPEPVRLKRPQGIAAPDMGLATLRRLQTLRMAMEVDGTPRPIFVPFSDPAAARMEAWWNALAELESFGRMASWIGKARGFVARLSLIVEFLRWAGSAGPEPETVSLDSLEAAISLFEDYLFPMARRTFGEAGLSDTERHAAILARWILKNRPDKVNVRELQRTSGLPGFDKADSIRDALDYLGEMGWVQAAFARQGDTAGRKQQIYAVNPALLLQDGHDVTDISDVSAKGLR